MIQPWILYGLSSGVCFASMAMIVRYVMSHGTPAFVVNLISFGVGFLLLLGVTLSKGGVKISETNMLVAIILGTILLITGNYLYFTTIGLAPNPGFATALKTTDILFATFLGWLIFRGQLTLVNALGVILVVLGVFLIAKK